MSMQACVHSINPVLLPINMCTSPYPAMYIKFNNASVINEYQDANCTTLTSHFALNTNTCHYMALANSAMVLYTTDNYTVTLATVDPNYNTATVNKSNMYLLIMVMIFISIVI